MSGRTLSLPVVLLCLIVALPLVSFGCGCEKSVYKIGAVLSLTGPALPLGQPEQRSLMLLEEKINEEGGIDGHPVSFLIRDDESEPAKANTAVTKLINQENVAAIIGGSTTGSTLAMAKVCEKSRVPQVCCAAGTKITQPVKEYVFRTPPSDAMAIEKLLGYLEYDLKVKKIAVLHDANAYGTGGADELESKCGDYGIVVVARDNYGSTDTNMIGQLTKIQGTDAEAVVVWGTNPGPASIAKNMKELNMTIPFVGSHGIANKKFIELAGEAANGVVFPAGRLLIPSSIPEGSEWRKAVEEFSKEYKDKYDMEIDTFAAHGWDAGLIITEAMKEAGTDGEKLNEQIEKTRNLVGIDGAYNYSPKDHDGLSVDDLIMIKIENGEWTQVKSS
ncbi:MAG: ABC transporter substrate-binding protein [Actinobacteria bacterium]|nr:ABC transporter substrate-binding protein [Actinomycetota bacterium]